MTSSAFTVRPRKNSRLYQASFCMPASAGRGVARGGGVGAAAAAGGTRVSVIGSLRVLGDEHVAQRLFDGGDIVGDQVHRFGLQGPEAVLDGERARGAWWATVDDRLADGIGECQHLVHADAVEESGAAAH